MIGAIAGRVIYRSGDVLIVDVNGVGYEVTVTNSVLQSFSSESQDKISLIVYTDVRENAINLYGFVSLLEKEVFLLLKRVKGIGSKIAINILSSVGSELLLQAIGRNDISRLKSIPGIGPKTAERVIVELRESVKEYALTSSEDTALTSDIVIEKTRGSRTEADVLLALEKLGFAGDRAKRMLTAALDGDISKVNKLKADPGELLRLALSQVE